MSIQQKVEHDWQPLYCAKCLVVRHKYPLIDALKPNPNPKSIKIKQAQHHKEVDNVLATKNDNVDHGAVIDNYVTMQLQITK